MANVKRCDRCAACYKLSDYEKGGYTKIVLADGREYKNLGCVNDFELGSYEYDHVYDLCPSCMADLHEFLKGGGSQCLI